MSSFLLTVLSATVALSTAQPSTAQPSTAQPTDCQPAIIGLSTALGISLTATAAAVVYVFKDRLCCTRGEHVYDTPCPYCDVKQPKACMREHIAECLEHKKYWTPRLQSQRITVLPLRSSLKSTSRVLPTTLTE